VTTTIRLYFDALIAVALMLVVAVICGMIFALITGRNVPNASVMAIAFLLTGAFLFFRLWRKSRTSALPPADASI
jgi:hypothetical protein